MKIIIIAEFIINFIFLVLFQMHMFQLNSYFLKKHLHWSKVNYKKLLIQLGLILLSVFVIISENTITSIITIIVLMISIIYNFPKMKSKISLKFTNRVIRMFITQGILCTAIVLICGFDSQIYLKMFIINILSFVICPIANIINSPIEYLGRKHYINLAKKKLKEMPNLIVIGVTGSFGKTSVKNYLYTVLSGKYEVLVTPKNYNTTMGVVKTIRENLKATHQIFICEMGATKLNDIKEICDIVNPQYGVITSIGPQHLESFKTIENVIKTKYELYDSVAANKGKMFLNCSNEYISKNIKDGIIYGIENDKLDYNAYNIKSSSKGLSFTIKDKQGKEVNFETELIGKHNVINLTGVIAVANNLGVSLEDVTARIRKIKNVEHRLQLISRENINIIDDSYNSNPVSSKSALETLSEFEGVRIVVTPGLIELGEDEDKYNYEFGTYMPGNCDYVYIVGQKNSKKILEGINSKGFDKKKVFQVTSPQEAMKKITKLKTTEKITVLLENDLPDNYN